MNISEHIENCTIVDMFPIVNEERQQEIIEKHPLHPMCKWYPSSSKVESGRNLFVNIKI